LIGADGRIVSRRVENPLVTRGLATRSVAPHGGTDLPAGHPRANEAASSSKALVRDQHWRPGNWGGAPSHVDPLFLGE
jgi:hypothetical protein